LIVLHDPGTGLSLSFTSAMHNWKAN
jgi:hypothetical protein